MTDANDFISEPGDQLAYAEMCRAEGTRLRRGMNFRLRGGATVVLMSRREDALYHDHFEEEGRVLLYQGHDAPLSVTRAPATVDQPAQTLQGTLTQNGLFHRAVQEFKAGAPPEPCRVYEKLSSGAWLYHGVYNLVDAWRDFDESGERWVWKFRLERCADG